MLKHDTLCLETASEEDGTPAVLLECDENNSNQVQLSSVREKSSLSYISLSVKYQ